MELPEFANSSRRRGPARRMCVLLILGIAFFQRPIPSSADDKASNSASAEFFETRVRPVLFHNCFACHGEKIQTAGLRLDSLIAMLKGGNSGPILTPGDPDKSSITRVIRYDGKIKMPPSGKLKESEIADLIAWVKMGAPWPQSPSADPANTQAGKNSLSEPKKIWSLQPVVKQMIPVVKRPSWVQTPIDNFILSSLEANKLKPSSQADKIVLLRRASFDLIGLPPTPVEIDEFISDTSPDAFAHVVDRLLSSPHFGERWARHWLDVARYADTKGYVFTEERRYPNAYTYRDYVIRAMNEDLPYDAFVKQQIAADFLVSGDDKRPLAALGFLTVGRRFLNSEPDIIADRIDVVSRGFLGLTVACARCHDHKFDPIPTRDYYSLYGIFASSEEPENLPVIGPPQDAEAYKIFEREVRAAEDKIEQFKSTKRAGLLAEARKNVGGYLLLASELPRTIEPQKLREAARDRNLNPVILRNWIRYLNECNDQDPILGPWKQFLTLPSDSFAQSAQELILKWADAAQGAGGGINRRVIRAFVGQPPESIKAVAETYSSLFAEGSELADDKSAVDGNRLDVPDIEQFRRFLSGDRSPLNAPSSELDRTFDRAVRNELREMQMKLDAMRVTHPGAPPSAMILRDRQEPVSQRVFIRGDSNNLGESVPRQFLEVLSPKKRESFTHGSGRLELAEAIACNDNPLTARVIVNRIWLHLFGNGLVRTPSDFGTRGDPPTHAELLDYLSWRFMHDGWSIKKLLRLIMLSSAYQQSSDNVAGSYEADPENRLLWRMNRKRLELEPLRDTLLAVSGGLDETMNGRAVDILKSPFSRRRTIYGFIDRQNLPGLFRVFDLASPDASSAQRHRTTIPQQALFMMNSPFVIDQARLLAARHDLVRLDPENRIRLLYRLLMGRSPSLNELRLGLDFIKGMQLHESQDTAPDGNRLDLNAWEKYGQALLMSSEFAFID